MSEWRSFVDSGELDRSLADHLAARLTADCAAAGRASLAVSGGTTPVGMFRELATREVDWDKVWLTLVDERQVPVSSCDSNERLVRDNLLKARAAAAHFAGLVDADGGQAAALAERMASMPRPFSAVVLGMGSDGHTASWFPRAENLARLLDPANPLEVAETDPLTAPHRRITLTLAKVLDSREIVIHITGSDKRSVIERAREEGYPVAAVLEQATTPVSVWWAP